MCQPRTLRRQSPNSDAWAGNADMCVSMAGPGRVGGCVLDCNALQKIAVHWLEATKLPP